MNLFSKKGELTTQQLVTIIVLIVSFVIILFLIFRLNLGETTDKEICRNSVVLRDKSPLAGHLDCRTNYLCVSGNGDCEGITEAFRVEIKGSSEEEIKNEIMKVLADEMSDCWWQFGEGRINYGSRVDITPGSGKVEYALCSIIEFNDIGVPEISYLEFYNYLRTTKKTESQTYLQYLYNTNTLDSVSIADNVKVDINSDKILTNQKYSIVTGIDNKLGTSEKINPDNILKVFIIPTEETGSRLEENREFITKA